MPSGARMSNSMTIPELNRDLANSDWHQLAEDVLAGELLTAEQALHVLDCPDEELLDLMSAAYRVRRRWFGNKVQLYFLMNAKSGLCPEDCAYCSQSKVSEAEIPRYNLLSRERLLEGARMAAERQARTYCIVISARGPNEREMQAVTSIVPEIKQQYDLKICASLGLLTLEQALELKECGVDRINHNLNTSDNYYGEICSTHSFADRLSTLRAVREAGLEICSGGIVGMGECRQDIVDLALTLRDLAVQSIPVNFLNPIDGTPLAGPSDLNPRYCLKVLAMFRLANPDREIRIAGGRELHLGSLQPFALYAANSLFVGDYLTTKGQPPDADYQMIRDLGFNIVRNTELSQR
ncbi:MAG: biotin synthase BioB [Pirellulales bacterium]|nr:biotin synthase BioB [Pirellulales bacterium]